ncbi:YkgJ family cysteine cluster protein, partial [Desulfonauticus submarinus]
MDKEIFYCQKCGHCCEGKGGIVVSLEEQNKISSFLNLSIEEFQKKYLEQNQGKDVIKTKNNFCIFFDPKKGCGIHPVKPKVCAAWPFFRGNLVDENAFEMAK